MEKTLRTYSRSKDKLYRGDNEYPDVETRKKMHEGRNNK